MGINKAKLLESRRVCCFYVAALDSVAVANDEGLLLLLFCIDQICNATRG